MTEKSTLAPGTTLQNGRYRIINLLGSGGFGCTYIAEALNGFRFAIKEFFPKTLCNRNPETSLISVGTLSQKPLVDKLRKKFINEALLLSKLKNDGLATVYDIFEENGTAYYVMELIEGSTVAELIARHGAISEELTLSYIRAICHTLDYVHSKNRLHLDIKPANIMVRRDGHAMLIDFGTSKQYDSENGENTSTLLGLTPGYAPIEQSDNDVTKFLPATDIYALGATIYTMLTGQTPPSAAKRVSGDDDIVLPSSVSTPTRKAVESAMQISKKLRPQSIAEFLAMLPDPSFTKTFDATVTTPVNDATMVYPCPAEAKPRQVKSEKAHENSQSIKKGSGIDKFGIIIGICGVVFIIFLIISLMKTNNSQEADSKSAENVIQTENNVVNSQTAVADMGLVDLGLSVRWSDRNLGSSSPDNSGMRYTLNDAKSEIRMMADGWRLPTEDETRELIDKCDWQWDGNGYRIISRVNGKSIYLPANKGDSSGLYWIQANYASQARNTGSMFSFTYSPNHPEWCPEINHNYSSSLDFGVRPVYQRM